MRRHRQSHSYRAVLMGSPWRCVRLCSMRSMLYSRTVPPCILSARHRMRRLCPQRLQRRRGHRLMGPGSPFYLTNIVTYFWQAYRPNRSKPYSYSLSLHPAIHHWLILVDTAALCPLSILLDTVINFLHPTNYTDCFFT